MSLKAGLESLLGLPCYHMVELMSRPEHVAHWRAAGEGGAVDWTAVLDGYGATSDFPACLFWREILGANPDAVVVLSTRHDPELWWQSASQTIFGIDASQLPPEMAEWFEMWRSVASARFTPHWTDKSAAIAAYERHNAEVRASAPPGRLVEWQPQDGWGPLCQALGVEAPDAPFPHLNRREDFPRADHDVSLPEAIERLRHGSSGPGHSG
jgi:hypothetical protein